MQVKRLEVEGFKSFKDKTVIHFDDGITGIVGPNGCGKSNIVDAFFWVMGEQSYKHMRGSGSEDLIFNGSSKYTPLGFAEATLVLETQTVDTEKAPSGASSEEVPLPMKKKEVSITRRVYRTGEGEYFLNGISCRLKDIHEFFMDTGIGAKGYSVIEQGQIDKVVNAKPDDRRLLIEEAAGIAKYKARKKESLRKMEAAESNLSRLNDVIQEIERSLNSLERQAQKAQKYKEYKNELFQKEIQWGRRKAKVIQDNLKKSASLQQAYEQDVAGYRAELQTIENNIEINRIEQLSLSTSFDELQTHYQNHSTTLAAEKSALELSRQRQEDLRSQLNALEQELIQLQELIEQENQKLIELKKQSEVDQQIYSSLKEEVRQLDEELVTVRTECYTSRENYESRKNTLYKDISGASELQSKLAGLLARLESSEALISKAAASKENLQKKSEENQKLYHQGLDLVSSDEQKLKELLAESELQKNLLKEKENTFNQKTIEKNEKYKQLTQVGSKLESLRELEKANEGLSEGSKKVLEWASANQLEGVFTSLANQLKVTEGYDVVVEAWFDQVLHSLLVKEPESALNAIEILKEKKAGRTHFLCTTQASQLKQNYNIEEALSPFNLKILGTLDQFVEVKGEQNNFSVFVKNFCQNVVVVESLARVIGNIFPFAVVALDGSVLSENGVLIGGSLEQEVSANLLARKREIQNLESENDKVSNEFEALDAYCLELQNEIQALKANNGQLAIQISELQIQFASNKKEIESILKGFQEAQSQLTQIDEELMREKNIQENLKKQQVDLDSQLQLLVERRAQTESELSILEEALKISEKELQEKEKKCQLKKIEETTLRERISSSAREVQSQQKYISDRQTRVVEIQKTLERVHSEKKNHSGVDATIAERIESTVKLLNETQEKISVVKDKLEQASQTLNDGLERSKRLHQLVDEKTGLTNEKLVEIEKLNSEFAHLKANLEEKYGPNCFDEPVASPIQEEMEDPIVTLEMTEEETLKLSEELEQLRERIRRLGEVNTMAIEEYEELKKRFDHLDGEKLDLLQSIENLKEAIEHINVTSKDRFQKAFDAISDRFEKLFPIIFGGGRAELSLVYPEGSTDVLDAGVDILAQPPGKKVSNISLLSGGEKALTAISLIFAIFMVKPSPFCLLDEVDAPLDDSNIGKFNALLKEMSAKTQFIVITHNKKTMELNDVLYGVTMEEPGVSKMVSINLS